MTYSFDINEAVDDALGLLSPRPRQPMGFKTGRSGLPVTILESGIVTWQEGGVRKNCLHARLDGAFDKYDAEQLGKFFTALAESMPNP